MVIFSTYLVLGSLRTYYEKLIGQNVKEFGKDGVILIVEDAPKCLSDGPRSLRVTMVSNLDEELFNGNLYGLM